MNKQGLKYGAGAGTGLREQIQAEQNNFSNVLTGRKARGSDKGAAAEARNFRGRQSQQAQAQLEIRLRDILKKKYKLTLDYLKVGKEYKRREKLTEADYTPIKPRKNVTLAATITVLDFINLRQPLWTSIKDRAVLKKVVDEDLEFLKKVVDAVVERESTTFLRALVQNKEISHKEEVQIGKKRETNLYQELRERLSLSSKAYKKDVLREAINKIDNPIAGEYKVSRFGLGPSIPHWFDNPMKLWRSPDAINTVENAFTATFRRSPNVRRSPTKRSGSSMQQSPLAPFVKPPFRHQLFGNTGEGKGKGKTTSP